MAYLAYLAYLARKSSKFRIQKVEFGDGRIKPPRLKGTKEDNQRGWRIEKLG
jgi:hypothetical protein